MNRKCSSLHGFTWQSVCLPEQLMRNETRLPNHWCRHRHDLAFARNTQTERFDPLRHKAAVCIYISTTSCYNSSWDLSTEGVAGLSKCSWSPGGSGSVKYGSVIACLARWAAPSTATRDGSLTNLNLGMKAGIAICSTDFICSIQAGDASPVRITATTCDGISGASPARSSNRSARKSWIILMVDAGNDPTSLPSLYVKISVKCRLVKTNGMEEYLHRNHPAYNPSSVAHRRAQKG